MWTKIKSVFGKASNGLSNVDNSLYNLKIVDGLDAPELNNAIDNMKKNKVDAYLIKNALDLDQINLLKKYYFGLEKMDKMDKEIAGTYPVSFITKMYAREYEESYFEDNEKFGESVKKSIGFDLLGFIESTLSKLNDGKQIVVKKAPNNKGSFAPFQFRALRKGGSNIHVHCENCHQTWAPELNNRLKEHKLQPNGIPYFFTIQKSKGGNIVLFDLKWKEGQVLDKINEDHFKVINPNGKKLDCSPNGAVKRMEIETQPGDLFIFNGGEIYHMVQRVDDDQKRITVGGFINTTVDNNEEIWA